MSDGTLLADARSAGERMRLAMRAVPRELDEAALALGATPMQTAIGVTILSAWPGILSALVLSSGRVFAESFPLIMTAGTTISRGTPARSIRLARFGGAEGTRTKKATR